jgi:DNA-binding response OmpR family regulator
MDQDRILVVDDEEPILFALSMFFEARGYRVDCARELEEAQALIAHIPYACVVADLRLTCAHGAEGLELVSFVRRSCATTRIILLTAYGSPGVEESAWARGGDAVLQKPIGLSTLADIVSELVAKPC